MSGGSVVAAIIRRGDDLLMVRQQGEDDPEPSWFIPSGRAEPGELVHEALAREVKEETGLVIGAPGHLGWISQHALDHPMWGGVWTAFGFEVPDPGGDPLPDDPDGIVSEAAWVPISEAVRRLREVPHAPMRDPVIAYVNGTAELGSVWIWRVGPGHSSTPLVTLHAARHEQPSATD